jgi:hypothetical protein
MCKTSIDLSSVCRHFGAISVCIIIIIIIWLGNQSQRENFISPPVFVRGVRCFCCCWAGGCIILFLYGAGTGLTVLEEEVPQSFGIWLSFCSYSAAPVRIVSFPHTLMTYTAENKQPKLEEKMRAKGGKKNTNHDGGRPNEHDEGKKRRRKKRINDWN